MPRGGPVMLQAPTGEPVSLKEAKQFLRVDEGDTKQDGVIQSLIRMARSHLQDAYNRQFVSAAYATTIDRFPRYSSSAVWQYNSDAIWQQRLPVTQLSGQWYPDRASIRVTRPPLQQLLYITYTDGNGVQQSLTNTVAAAIPAGLQTVTPATMYGVVPGLSLVIDLGSLQETVLVASVTATTFTATFLYSHGIQSQLWAVPTIAGSGSPLNGGALVSVDATTEPARIAPAYGQIWPIVRQQLGSIQVGFVAGYGPSTTIPAATALGLQTVAPVSMFGIYPQTRLVIDLGTNAEEIAVQSITATTFAAIFNQIHPAGCQVMPAFPEGVANIMKLIISTWFLNRDAQGAVDEQLGLVINRVMTPVCPWEYE